MAAIELPVDDGIEFAPTSATAEAIREEDDYFGVRVHVEVRLARATLPFHVAVNVGDPIWPRTDARCRASASRRFPRSSYRVIRCMVHAEKIVTAIQRGTANTRWRDFNDIWSLSRQHPTSVEDLAGAVDKVAQHRGATVRPLADVLDGYAALGQAR